MRNKLSGVSETGGKITSAGPLFMHGVVGRLGPDLQRRNENNLKTLWHFPVLLVLSSVGLKVGLKSQTAQMPLRLRAVPVFSRTKISQCQCKMIDEIDRC